MQIGTEILILNTDTRAYDQVSIPKSKYWYCGTSVISGENISLTATQWKVTKLIKYCLNHAVVENYFFYLGNVAINALRVTQSIDVVQYLMVLFM